MNMDWLNVEFFLSVVGWLALGLTIAAAMLLNVLGLFGNWLLLGAFAVVWVATGWVHVGWLGIALMLIFAVLGEILETALAGYGARRFGGSKGSMVAALVGCIGGAIFLTALIPIPLIGTIIGACIGAFGAAAIYDYIQHERTPAEAVRIGWGATLGKLGGMFAKFICGVVILAVAWWTW